MYSSGTLYAKTLSTEKIHTSERIDQKVFRNHTWNNGQRLQGHKVVVFEIQGLPILTRLFFFFMGLFVGLLGQELRLGLDNFLLFILSDTTM